MFCKTLDTFQVRTHGKWILTGEHAVVRGQAALVFPCDQYHLHFSVEASKQFEPIEVRCDEGDSLQMAAWVLRVLEYAMQYLDKPFSLLTGKIRIHSNIPPGCGLGSSAALCVAIAKWFVERKWIPLTEVSVFARELEHLFHGRSSGLDIAGVEADFGVYFKQGQVVPIQMSWQPNWRLSYSGETGKTADCIDKVKKLWETRSDFAAKIDKKMSESVDLACQALAHNTLSARAQLRDAIDLARYCFDAWGLMTPALSTHIQSLFAQGALAAKPTGSGGGGMVVSLWPEAHKTP